jgi:hypothetical protein
MTPDKSIPRSPVKIGDYLTDWKYENFSDCNDGIKIPTTGTDKVYPYIGIRSTSKYTMIVLFSSTNTGTCLFYKEQDSKHIQPGDHCQFWAESKFNLYDKPDFYLELN